MYTHSEFARPTLPFRRWTYGIIATLLGPASTLSAATGCSSAEPVATSSDGQDPSGNDGQPEGSDTSDGSQTDASGGAGSDGDDSGDSTGMGTGPDTDGTSASSGTSAGTGTDAGTGGDGTSGTDGGGGATTGGLDEPLYWQTGTDPTWEEVLASGALIIGENSSTGVKGSTIDVNNPLVELGPYADNDIIGNDLRIHTVGHSSIPRSEFDRWTRWYQEDGNTQVFRLFEGEENVRNDRELAARIESFAPSTNQLPQPGVWREWVGRYTLITSEGCSAPHKCAIFQAKGNNVDHWSVMLNVDDQGNVWLNRRSGEDEIIASDMTNRSFDVRVRDNGLDYEVYLNGEFKGSGQWERTLEVGFRWGIYVGASALKGPVMVFVTGAAIQ